MSSVELLSAPWGVPWGCSPTRLAPTRGSAVRPLVSFVVFVFVGAMAPVALNVPGTHSEHVVEPWEAA